MSQAIKISLAVAIAAIVATVSYPVSIQAGVDNWEYLGKAVTTGNCVFEY